MAKGKEQRAKGKEQRAKGKEQRAKGEEQRARGKEQKAKERFASFAVPCDFARTSAFISRKDARTAT